MHYALIPANARDVSRGPLVNPPRGIGRAATRTFTSNSRECRADCYRVENVLATCLVGPLQYQTTSQTTALA
eukprot:4594181-Prymnesium_polylepis.1